MKAPLLSGVLLSIGIISGCHTDTNIRLSGVCDGSAVVWVQSGLWTASDESDALYHYVQMSGFPKTYPQAQALGIPVGSELDIEGSARGKKGIYWIGSHGRNKHGKHAPTRQWLWQTDANTGALLGRSNRLLNAILASPKHQSIHTTLAEAIGIELQQAPALAPKKRGFNIESLSMMDNGLLIGLRNPLHQGKAIVLHLANPQSFLQGKPAIFHAPYLLNLNGQSLRAMAQTAPQSYALIAGAAHRTEHYQLYRWQPVRDKHIHIKQITLPKGVQAEGLFIKNAALWLTTDEGNRQNPQGVVCKDTTQTQGFSVIRLMSLKAL